MASFAPHPDSAQRVEWSVASAPMQGEVRSGDQSVVRGFAGGVLVGAVDGLGHGDDAASAASQAVQILGEYSGASLLALIRQCHAALVGTRGVVMSLAWFDAEHNTMTWAGVGNVEGVLHRGGPTTPPAVERLVPVAGVVGYRLPSLHPVTMDVRPGDLLVLATDGIRSDFVEAVTTRESPAGLATQLLGRYGRPTDDALVLVARYLGKRST